MTYDPKSEELARHFLSDEPESELRESRVKHLAEHIQREIENWLDWNSIDPRS